MKYKNLINLTIALTLTFNISYAEITEVGQCDTPGRARDVFILGDYAYIADMGAGLTVIDISDPEDPEIVGNFADYEDPEARGIFVVDGTAFIADHRLRLISLDISNLDNINQLDEQGTNDYALNVIVTGDIACVACDERDLGLFDVSDPENIRERSYWRAESASSSVYVIENTVYVAQCIVGLYIVDISDPRNPRTIGSVDAPDNASGVYVSGDYAYIVGYRDCGLQIIDVSDPEDPNIVGNCDFNGAYRVYVVDDYAFVSDIEDDDLTVVDVSNPEDPEIIESYDTESDPYNIEVVGNYAFIANSGRGLLILDVSDYTFTGPRIDLSDEELDFEEVGLDLSRELPLTITNIGNEDLVISEMLIEGDYFSTDFEDEFTLEPDEEADVTVTFTPEERGEFEGTLTITSNDEENEEVEVALLGEGVGPQISVHPRSLDFGEVGIGGEPELELTIRNRGLNDLVISDVIILVGQTFQSDFDGEFTLEPGDHHELTVTFTPEQGIDYADTLIITSNDPDNGEIIIPMTGTGVGATITTEPVRLDFGEVGLGRSAELPLIIRNEGLIDLTIFDIVIEDDYFSVDFDEEVVIEPNRSIRVTATFSPEEDGVFDGIMIIGSNDRRNEELIVPLTGTGVGPRIAVDQDTLVFGLVSVGREEIEMLTIRAVGYTDLTITDISIEGDHFSVDFEGEVFIEIGSRYQVLITFTPEDDGELESALIIASDDANNPEFRVILRGTGLKGVLVDTPGETVDVTVAGSYAFVADNEGGLRIFNVINPLNPTEAGICDILGTVIGIDVAGDYAYIANGDSGMALLDISNLDNIEIVAKCNTPGNACDVVVSGEYVYVADGNGGLRVIDVYDPMRPVEVGRYDTEGVARGIAISGDYAYIADDACGLRIIDVTDPEHPDEVGSFDTRGWAWDVCVSGNYAYVADERRGLRIIDVSDPERPAETGFHDTPDNAYGVAVIGSYAYVGDGAGGLRIIDVADPENPFEAEAYYCSGSALDVTIAGDYAYVACGESGLVILDVSDFVAVDTDSADLIPAQFDLMAAYPNPFNSTTSITYALPVPSPVTLSIYDQSGRKIATLVNAYSSPGYYNYIWSPDRLSSGLYLIRLEACGQVQTSKVVLVR